MFLKRCRESKDGITQAKLFCGQRLKIRPALYIRQKREYKKLSNPRSGKIRDVSKSGSLLCKARLSINETLEGYPPQKWKTHVLFCAIGLGLASVHRVTLAILSVTFQSEFGFTLPQLGVLQSAMLWGYVIGQIPTGYLADKWGGSPLMVASLLAWCSTSALMPATKLIPHGYAFYYILILRVLLGLFQSGIITSTAAMCARWVPEKDRSKSMGFCYFLYSGGTVLGLWATPLLSKPLGWPAAYMIYAIFGYIWAAFGSFGLAPEQDALNYGQGKQQRPNKDLKEDYINDWNRKTTKKLSILSPSKAVTQIGILIWTHSAIGWGFTFLQNWIPTILSSMGMTNLKKIGFIACLPWVAASLVSLAAGVIADWLYKDKGWSLVEVRKFSQNLASLGPAAALFLLACLPDLPVDTAVGLLVAAAGLQAFAYAGFHSYAQDVASQDVGKLLGYTNTGGTVLGVICNLLTGSLAGGPQGFSFVFYITAGIYFVSFITWNVFMKGDKIFLS